MKDVQCFELFGGIAHKNHAFSFSILSCDLLLSLSMFTVAQAFISLTHGCKEISNSDTISGGADICNCMSSAYG